MKQEATNIHWQSSTIFHFLNFAMYIFNFFKKEILLK